MHSVGTLKIFLSNFVFSPIQYVEHIFIGKL